MLQSYELWREGGAKLVNHSGASSVKRFHTGRINPAEAYRILLELGNCNIATGNNTSIAANLTGGNKQGM